MMAGRLGENPRPVDDARRPSGPPRAKRSAFSRATTTAAAHIAQGSSVTHKVQSSSRDVPSLAAAARIASISACAVGSFDLRIALRALGDDFIAEGHHRADRHFAGRQRRRRRGRARGASAEASGKLMRPAASGRREPEVTSRCWSPAAAWFCAGFCDDQRRHLHRRLLGPDLDRPGLDIERRRLPALGRDAVAGRGDLAAPWRRGSG